MSQQQSFHHPLLSNATLYDRMFRIKPYTKCIQCLSNDKLKCRKCMESIIEDISKNQNVKRLSKTRESSLIGSNKYSQIKKQENSLTKCLSINRRSSDKENIMITSKYNWWLAERIRKRQENHSFRRGWPRKLKSTEINFNNFESTQPRFQRWEKKLIDQLMSKKE